MLTQELLCAYWNEWGRREDALLRFGQYVLNKYPKIVNPDIYYETCPNKAYAKLLELVDKNE